MCICSGSGDQGARGAFIQASKYGTRLLDGAGECSKRELDCMGAFWAVGPDSTHSCPVDSLPRPLLQHRGACSPPGTSHTVVMRPVVTSVLCLFACCYCKKSCLNQQNCTCNAIRAAISVRGAIFLTHENADVCLYCWLSVTSHEI